jgi:glycosyltransferase involved in cell wall biosynthesis
MERAAAYIVPLRVGGGTRLKIYEAMALEKPIVSTTIGAEGLPVTDGNELRIADTPESFAAAVVELLKDQETAKAMGNRAAAVVRSKFGWAGVSNRFAEICERTIRDSAGSLVTTEVAAEGHEQPAV